jgi:hypothetical protein
VTQGTFAAELAAAIYGAVLLAGLLRSLALDDSPALSVLVLVASDYWAYQQHGDYKSSQTHRSEHAVARIRRGLVFVYD